MPVPPSLHPFVPSLQARPTGEIWYEVPYLQRLPLNTDYVEQVRTIRGIYAELKAKCGGPAPVLVLDATGVGEPVCDLCQGQGLNPVRIWFSGGNRVTSRPNGFTVPKGEIVGALHRAIGRRELKISAAIPEAATLIEEATRMEAVQNPSGHIRYSHREGEHDDLVLSVGIGLVACVVGGGRPGSAPWTGGG